MFCQHCGKEINDNAMVCVNCGCPIKEIENQKEKQYGLKVTILTLSWFSVFFTYVLILPLLWKIPMVITLRKKLKNNEFISTSRIFCHLLFVGVISGILLIFIDDSKSNEGNAN